MNKEEKEAIDILQNCIADYVIGDYCEKCGDRLICEDRNEDCYFQQAIDIAINLIEKQSKEIEELKREKETNQQMIQLAETQILGYGQGYKDGLNKETTATAIMARERENQIIYEGMKHKINMEWVFKIKAKIEEYERLSNNITIQPQIYPYIIEVLQSLLEKE